MSTLRTYVEAVETKQTNITRVLNLLMQYPARWRPNVGEITANPLSQFVTGQFSAPGRMKSEEIAHIINDWPMDQKEDLRTEVLRAIEVGRRMKFSWDQTSAEAPSTDIVWPPDNAPMSVPVSVTFRSPKRGIQISEEEEGTDTDVVIQSAGPFPDD